jgi:hypothetical protein
VSATSGWRCIPLDVVDETAGMAAAANRNVAAFPRLNFTVRRREFRAPAE